MKKTEEKTALEKIIKFNNGLTAMSNAGINLELELSYELSLFKQKTAPFVTAFSDTLKAMKGTEAELQDEINGLLKKEYDVEIPSIPLSALKESKAEVPLSIFDLIGENITK